MHIHSWANRPLCSHAAAAVVRVVSSQCTFTLRYSYCDIHVLSCPVLSVCDIGVLWANGWMDQDETWHAGRPRPWLHCGRWRPSSPCVSWGPSSPPQKGAEPPQFLAHICCGQMAGWIEMPLGREIGLGPGDIVLDRLYS